jgi:hypothetical protein
MQWHYCFQYVNHGRPRTCTAPQIMYVVKPLQEQYVNETVATGLLERPGNGAFFHSCHSGGYWVSADGPKGEWNMISVDNVTMQQAVSTWWEASRTAKSVMIADCYWKTEKPFLCEPNREERRGGGGSWLLLTLLGEFVVGNPICATLPGPYSSANASMTHLKTDDNPTFAQWAQDHGKTYNKGERLLRARVFENNLRIIREHNSGSHSWRMGVTPFTDLTSEEFVQSMLSTELPPASTHDPRRVRLLEEPAANVTVDWRTAGAVTPVKNQEHCGACCEYCAAAAVLLCVTGVVR